MNSTNWCALLLVVIFFCASSVFGHSYVTTPTSRSNQKQSESGCRGPACLGPCDVPLAQARTPQTTIQRGASINVQWPRNNHAGGFIRFAWAPTANSDSHAPFDAGVQQINCHEIGGCKPDDPTNPNGGDSGAGDGSFQPCQTTITVPGHLTDGAWTLQWAWFGGAFALGDYYSCIDYIISGGAMTAQLTPYFHGGDYSYPGQPVCKFFNTDRLHQCINEPCNNPIYPNSQQESGPAYGIAVYNPNSSGSSSSSTSSSSGPVTTNKAVTPNAATTKSATTKAVTTQALTTGHKAGSSSSSSSEPVTTHALTTSAVASNPNNQPSQANCAGATNPSISTATITSVDTWGDVFRMVITLTAQEAVLSGWMVEVIWPPNAVNTQITATYNGGLLVCQSSSPVQHSMIRPIASWADNIPQGGSTNIEILASNTNMDSGFIMANTILKVFKQ